MEHIIESNTKPKENNLTQGTKKSKSKMHALAESVWEVISWKMQPVYDAVTDQYTRIFMPKLFIVSSLIMAFSYFNDKLNCLITDRLHSSTEFVQETCWIQGFYIYEEMHTRLNVSSYYGIPEFMGYDGIDENGQLCQTIDHAGVVKRNCRAMKKRYFLHYQWLPFYVCSLVVLFYSPYVLYKIINSDIISLVDTVNNGIKDIDKLVSNYFNYRINSKWKMKIVVSLNILIKIFYMAVNCGGFLMTDFVMDGRFLSFGLYWVKWNKYPNNMVHDISKRISPKPGDYLIPSVGICDIHETLTNKRMLYNDKHRIICEISENIKYQYIFIIIWFFLALGVLISTLGFLLSTFMIVKSLFLIYKPKLFERTSFEIKVSAQLTIRELEYLDKIKSTNLSIYGEVVKELTRFRPNFCNIEKYVMQNGDTVTLIPSAPKEETMA